ncbi:hypothetical protein DNTS_008619, partial [Danionella cerebrum]
SSFATRDAATQGEETSSGQDLPQPVCNAFTSFPFALLSYKTKEKDWQEGDCSVRQSIMGGHPCPPKQPFGKPVEDEVYVFPKQHYWEFFYADLDEAQDMHVDMAHRPSGNEREREELTHTVLLERIAFRSNSGRIGHGPAMASDGALTLHGADAIRCTAELHGNENNPAAVIPVIAPLLSPTVVRVDAGLGSMARAPWHAAKGGAETQVCQKVSAENRDELAERRRQIGKSLGVFVAVSAGVFPPSRQSQSGHTSPPATKAAQPSERCQRKGVKRSQPETNTVIDAGSLGMRVPSPEPQKPCSPTRGKPRQSETVRKPSVVVLVGEIESVQTVSPHRRPRSARLFTYRLVKHHIDTGQAIPILLRPHRLPITKRQVAEELIHEMAASGIIEPLYSLWPAPVVLPPPFGLMMRLTPSPGQLVQLPGKLATSDTEEMGRGRVTQADVMQYLAFHGSLALHLCLLFLVALAESVKSPFIIVPTVQMTTAPEEVLIEATKEKELIDLRNCLDFRLNLCEMEPACRKDKQKQQTPTRGDRAKQKSVQQELKQRQRAEIYALNKVMTELEQQQFEAFCKQMQSQAE